MSLEQALKKIQDKSREIVKEGGNAISKADGFLDIEKADISFNKKRRIVKASLVYLAAQVAISRFGCKVYPGFVKTKLTDLLIDRLERGVGRVIAERVAGSLPGAGILGKLVAASIKGVNAEDENKKVEKLIRECFVKVRKDFNAHACLSQKAKPRKVKDVHSRHYSKLKRKRKKWHTR